MSPDPDPDGVPALQATTVRVRAPPGPLSAGGVVALMILTVALAGCLQGAPSSSGTLHTIRASTYYDDNRTAQEDRDRARDLGFEDGDPATRGEPDLLVAFGESGSSSSTGSDAVRCHRPEEGGLISDPLRDQPRFCIALTATGQADFQVAVDGRVVLRSIGVDGADPVNQSCDYGGEMGGAWGLQPDTPIDEDLTFDVPFGIKCRD